MAVDIFDGRGIYLRTVGNHDTDPFVLQADPVPISQKTVERIRNEFKAKYEKLRWRNPIILDTPSLQAEKCEYCGVTFRDAGNCKSCGGAQ